MRIGTLMCLLSLLSLVGCVGERTTTTLDTSSPRDASTDVAEDTGGEERRCLLQNGEGLLSEGSGPKVCELTECYAGFGDCDSNGTNGCEASLSGAVNNCGECGVSCGAGESCVDGACICGDAETGEACAEGSVCCQGACVAPDDARCACGDQTSGCTSGEACCDDACVSILESDSHCGACGNPCGANTACTSGSCVCEAGFADCDKDPGNGCETSTNEVTNCGSCGVTCGAGEVCEGGVCQCGTSAACEGDTVCCQDACVSPTDPTCSCGGQASCAESELCCSDACAAVLSDAQNCGACGRACQGDTLCQNGSCACPESAPNDCGDGACANFLNDTNNCGGCGNICADGQSCCGGTCVDTQASNLHCGACFADGGERCSGATACCGGTCADLTNDVTCGSCDNNCASIGSSCCGAVCFDLEKDSANCGACGVSCGEGGLCNGGACACEAPLANCDNDFGNGCEVDLQIDDANCGECGVICAPSEVCQDGRCACDTFAVVGGGPKPNARSVPPSRLITINFSCEINPETVNSQTIRVYSSLRGFVEPFWTADGNRVQASEGLNPYPGERMFVVVTDQVRSINNVSATPFTFEFRFAAAGSGAFDGGGNFRGIPGSYAPGHIDGVGVQLDTLPMLEVIALQDETGDVCVWEHCNCGRVLQGTNCYPLPTGGQSRGVDTGDFDNNGFVDAVVAVSGGGDSAFMLNFGSNELRLNSLTIPAGDYEDVMTADFDSDGDIDIYFVSTSGRDILLLGNGAGGFDDAKASLSTARAISGGYGDFDGNGTLDVAIGTASAGVEIWLNDPASGFKLASSFLVGADIADIAVGDMDDDGGLDLVLAVANDANTLLLNSGDAKFQASGQDFDGASLGVEIGDIDSDTNLDVVFVDPAAGRIWQNDGGGKFISIDSFETFGAGSIFLADFGDFGKLDGVLDILVFNRANESNVVQGR